MFVENGECADDLCSDAGVLLSGAVKQWIPTAVSALNVR